MSDEPLTALAEGAAAMHELFSSLVAAGFSETQALTLIGYMMWGQQPREGQG